MSNYVAPSATIQQRPEFFGFDVRNWMTSRLVAWREARAKRLNLAFLRSLDRRALEDVGIDVETIELLGPSLASQHAAVLAVSFLGGASQNAERW